MSSELEKNKLFNKLNSICDVLRKTMEAFEYRNYILGFIFYKFLSDKLVNTGNELLLIDKKLYLELDNKDPSKKIVKENLIEQLGYYVDNEYLFSSWIKKIKNNEQGLLDLVEESFRQIENSSKGIQSEKDFENLFNDIDLSSSKLGNSTSSREKTLSIILTKLDEINFSFEKSEIDILGDAYEHLIANFASESGKKAGEFYTPQEVAEVLARIVTLGRKKIKNAYDPACGSGSLLLQIGKFTEVGTFYGQEVKETTFNLARMNMFLRGKDYHDFDIRNDDTILNPKHLEKDGKKLKFDAIVANPPFSLPWESPKSLLSDERFIDFGILAPDGYMDYAFIQHMLYQLDDSGVMASVVSPGLLFRVGAEGTIRQFIIEKKNWLDGVIGLPPNIFYGTNILSCILVFRKNRKTDDKVMFIEASREFIKNKKQNKLSNENINKIVETFNDRKEIDKYSKLVSLDEIKENEYNLNLTRYIDTFEEEKEIDIKQVNFELLNISKEIKDIDEEIDIYLKELLVNE